jgi:hypothetical protein
MLEDKGDGSMYKKIEILDVKLDEHGNRITALEKADVEKSETIKLLEIQFASIKTDFTNLENTIWKTAQSTQDHFSAQNAQQHELIKTMNEGKENERERRHDLSKTKLEKYSEVIMKVAGAGGILFLLLELIFGQ